MIHLKRCKKNLKTIIQITFTIASRFSHISSVWTKFKSFVKFCKKNISSDWIPTQVFAYFTGSLFREKKCCGSSCTGSISYGRRIWNGEEILLKHKIIMLYQGLGKRQNYYYYSPLSSTNSSVVQDLLGILDNFNKD